MSGIDLRSQTVAPSGIINNSILRTNTLRAEQVNKKLHQGCIISDEVEYIYYTKSGFFVNFEFSDTASEDEKYKLLVVDNIRDGEGILCLICTLGGIETESDNSLLQFDDVDSLVAELNRLAHQAFLTGYGY